MKALEKDRARRYETASGLARDVERYLKDEPVEACPPTAGYRLRKFARKNQKLLVTAAAYAVLLLLGVAASAWQAVRATQAEAVALAAERQANDNAVQAQEKEQEANKQRDEVQALNEKLKATLAQLRRTTYAVHMNLAQHTWDAGAVERVRELLDQHRPKMGETDLRHFEWHFLNRLCHAEILLTLKDQFFQIDSMAPSPDGRRFATATTRFEGKKGIHEVKVWDVQTGEVLLTLKEHAFTINSVSFSQDGKRLASAGGDVKVWDV
jgi:eukaryotic-like serine/threonine-protein kinase